MPLLWYTVVYVRVLSHSSSSKVIETGRPERVEGDHVACKVQGALGNWSAIIVLNIRKLSFLYSLYRTSAGGRSSKPIPHGMNGSPKFRKAKENGAVVSRKVQRREE